MAPKRKTPPTAKPKKSGAQFRKQRREREEAVFAESGEGAKELPPAWKKRWKDVGAPPADVVQRVEWANKCCALMIYEQLIAPELRSPAERRLVLEGIRTLGMTAVKALYEQRLKRVEGTLYGGAVREELDEVDGLEPDPTARPTS
jgi:hypothetical protein